MKIFLAGATGVVGRFLVPDLVRAGHEVTGTTRRRERAGDLARLGAEPVVVDVLDREALHDAVGTAAPEVVIHQLTDLAGGDRQANAELRIHGTRSLVDAALAAGVTTMIAQSICWAYQPGTGPAAETVPLDTHAAGARGRMVAGVAALESAVAEMPRGVVLRYGLLYGPGTWYETPDDVARVVAAADPADPTFSSFLHVEDAALAAVAALDWPAGPVNVTDDDPAGPRPADNHMAHAWGWTPRHPSWRSVVRPR